MAKVSAEIVRPKPGFSSEGLLDFHIDFSPMASPDFTTKTSSEIYISRLLEKALKKSKAVDVEGLCIIAEEKVWSIRVDIRLLDHNGNITDCSCIAAVAALLNFKRPDVSVVGEKVTVVNKSITL